MENVGEKEKKKKGKIEKQTNKKKPQQTSQPTKIKQKYTS